METPDDDRGAYFQPLTSGKLDRLARSLGQLFTDAQANANGLVQTLEQGIGPVTLLGNFFMVDGTAEPARRGAPALGEHLAEMLGETSEPA